MKTLVLRSFLCFSIFTACAAYAGDSSMVVNYPAPSGSYNKIVLQNSNGDPNCAAPGPEGVGYSNAGILFMHNNGGTQTLEICTNDGTATPVPYPETCFNRFCSCLAATPSVPCTCAFTSCPTGYSQAHSMVDSFTPDGGTTYVNSTICCSQPNINGTPTNSTVLVP